MELLKYMMELFLRYFRVAIRRINIVHPSRKYITMMFLE